MDCPESSVSEDKNIVAFGKIPCFHPWVKKMGRHLPLGPSVKTVLVVGHPFFHWGDGNRSNFKVTIFLCYTKSEESQVGLNILCIY
jgi:hypothetical protein